jgi:hypothetical protein
MGFNVSLLKGVEVPAAWELSNKLECIAYRPQFICNDWPLNIKKFQRTDLSELII